MTTEAKTACICGHDKHLHLIEMEDKLCSQCPCWGYTTSKQVRKPNESTKQEPVKYDLDTEIRKIKEEFGIHFTKCDELIKRLGNAIKKAGIVKESDICHEVKNILAEETSDQKISVRTIDRCCPDEWKHITKPKKKKDNLSFSKPVEIAITQDGKSKTLQDITPRGHGVEEKSAIDSESAKHEKPATPISAPTEQESAAATTSPKPQGSKPEQQPHEIRLPSLLMHGLLLHWDSLSEQMGQVHSPGIEWVRLYGALDEESGKISNLRLTRAEGGV